MFILEQETSRLIIENKQIKDKAKTDVRNLEEYIQQEAKDVKEKVKKFEATMLHQIEVIERQNIEIQKCYEALKTTHSATIEATTREDTEEVVQEVGSQERAQGDEVAGQELSREEARQEGTREGSRQELTQEGTVERGGEGDENEPWQQQARQRFECPICGLGRRTKGQIEKHMSTHDKQNDDSQFNCKECQYQTINRDQLSQHMEMTHKSKAEFECNLCNTFFRTRKDLNIHSKDIHNKTFKPCRNFPSKNCEYDSECHFYHIILNQGEHICFTGSDVFNGKTPLLHHISSVHGQEICKRFKDNKCHFGDKCFFKHINTQAHHVTRNAQSVRIPQENIISPTPCDTPPQDFQSVPTSWNRVVGTQNKPDMIMNMNQMAQQIGLMMNQMSHIMSQMNLN